MLRGGVEKVRSAAAVVKYGMSAPARPIERTKATDEVASAKPRDAGETDMHLAARGTSQALDSMPVAAAAPGRGNVALAALSQGARAILEPHLQLHDLAEGTVLWEPGDEVEGVYFPLSGLISIVLPLKDGAGIEVASIGREGCAGVDHALAP